MGGLAVDFVGYKFEHTNRRRVSGGWLVTGTVYWTLGSDRLQTMGWRALLKDWGEAGYKIGFLLKEEQTIKKLVYGGVSLSRVRPQAAQIAELDATHGTPEKYAWHVWGGHGDRNHEILPPNIIKFPVTLTLSGGQAPQMIPVVSRHLKGPFAQSVGGLWVISPRRRATTRHRRKAVRRPGSSRSRRGLRAGRRARA